MGGLLAAEIALVFRHRIIGIVNFDVPFLGMHPGIVKVGLGSLFSPAPPPQDSIVPGLDTSKKPTRINTLFNPHPSDPNYNPSFSNDVQLPLRKGWDNTLHWLTKHYHDGLRQATKGLVKSHLEFGGAMADYRELTERYAKIRALEEEDDEKRSAVFPTVRPVPRVRFVNYYTASTGRPKKSKSPQSSKATTRSHSPSRPPSLPSHDSSLHHPSTEPTAISLDSLILVSDCDSAVSSEAEMARVHPYPTADSPRNSSDAGQRQKDGDASNSKRPVTAIEAGQRHAAGPEGAPNLPVVPPIPQEPPFVDLLHVTNKTARKAAEKKHALALQEYQKAVKVRNNVINERSRLEEKWEKQQEQGRAERKQRQAEAEMRNAEARQRRSEADQREKEAASRMTDEEKKVAAADHQSPLTLAGVSSRLEEHLGAVDLGASDTARLRSPRSALLRQASPATTPSADRDTPATPKKLRRFCLVPAKDSQGKDDPTWIRVFMEGVDEVTAHTTLFFVNETYERLVGDVSARIEDWVREADSVRLVRELSGME